MRQLEKNEDVNEIGSWKVIATEAKSRKLLIFLQEHSLFIV